MGSKELSSPALIENEFEIIDTPSKNQPKTRKKLDELLEDKRLRYDLNEYNDYDSFDKNYDDALNQFDIHRYNTDDYY